MKKTTYLWLRRIYDGASSMDEPIKPDDLPTYEEAMAFFGRSMLDEALTKCDGDLALARKSLRLDKASFCRMRRLYGLRKTSASSSKPTISSVVQADNPTIDCGEQGRCLFISPAMLAIRKTIGEATKIPGSILIQGPAGSGKSILALAIHEIDEIFRGPLFVESCFDIEEEILASCLFGWEEEEGLLELARGGTLILEDVENLSGYMLNKLADMLKNGVYRRIGESEWLHCETRIIVTTRLNPSFLQNGNDMLLALFKLFEWRLELPPFDSRCEEIIPLAEEFLRREGASDCKLSKEAEQKLLGKKYSAGAHTLETRVLEALENADEEGVKLINGEMIEDDRYFVC